MATKKNPKDPGTAKTPKAAGNGSQRPKKTPMGQIGRAQV